MNRCFDAFISYGRADSKAFATKLHSRLVEQGLKVWFDQNDIPLGVDFQEQIYDGIEKADNFLFIIAPHSVKSVYCLKEILWAIEHNKRIIPLLHVEPNDCWDKMHPAIGKINWVYFREEQDDFENAFTGLINLIQRHQDYVEQHTQLLVKALDWERHQKQNSYLLTGEERQQAESWLKRQFKDEQPPCKPTDLHCEFISESTKNAHNWMTQVFISYAEKDQEFMKKIRRTLLRQGFTVWTNKTDIQIGTEFQEEINKGIEGADNLVWLISPKSLQSWYCQEEIAHAFAHNKRIIPLLIEPTEVDATTLISNGLSSVQFIDFTHCIDEIKYQKEADKLLKTLNQDAYYYEQHKTLLVKALKWLRQNRNPSILLRGYNLKQAEAWLKVAKQRTEHLPLSWHEEFITESAKQPPESSLDVFISYSRVDSDFARKLNDALQLQGKTTWFDQESIASGVDFQQEIDRGIETANNFLFIISPSSVNSPYCASEVEYAAKLNKRVVTVLYRGVSSPELHPILAGIQWIDFNKHSGDFYANFSELIRTLDTDTEHVWMHTRLLARALEWEREGRDDSFLLRGKDLEVSQLELRQSADKEPKPNALQLEYLKASRELPFRNIKRRSVVLTSAVVTVLVVVARFFGGMEPAELRVYDHLMRLRPSEPQDERFLIVEVDAVSSEALRKDMIAGRYQPGIGTIPDKALDEALATLSVHQPRLIGLDFYRDFKAQPELAKRFRQTQNLIALCKASSADGQGNIPPTEVPMERIGFNDFSQDGEDFVRRHLLLQEPDPKFCNMPEAFSLVLARKYLESKGISYTSPQNDQGNYVRDMQFGKTAIPQLSGNGSSYQETGDRLQGYQTLLNYRAYKGDPNNFAPTVSLKDVLDGKVSAKDIQDRIVIIGYTDAADRNADHWHTSYGDMPGVIVQAQMASQIISAVLDQRPLIWWMPIWGEILWIFGWSTVGGLVVWRFSRPYRRTVFSVVVTLFGLYGACYFILVSQSAWVPLLPPAIAVVVTGGGVGYLTYRLRQT